MKVRAHGYTLVETLIAAVVLLIGIAAAATLALTTLGNEEANNRMMRAFNQQEQAAKLYQLGLSTNAVANLLLPDSSISSLQFTANASGTYSNAGTVEQATLRLVYWSGPMVTSASSPSGTVATNTVTLIRPTYR